MNEPLITDEQFAEMGEEVVRLKLANNQFNLAIAPQAIHWLARRDQESRSRIDSSQSRQIRLAHKANTIAIAAVIIATIAAIAAIVGAIAAIMAL